MPLTWPFRRKQAPQAGPVERVTFPAPPFDYPPDVMDVPVLVVRYLPAVHGRVRRAETGDVDAALDDLRAHTDRVTRGLAEALEVGSIYHGYRDPAARPSLRYRVAGELEVLEPLPTHAKAGHRIPMTDYQAIAARADLRRWVEGEGVKEVWLWGYHGGVVDLWESNMAGPYGDVSNSDRDPGDLPVFGQTYTMYHYNYGRGLSEAMEDHMHQVEALLRHVDPHLFWDRFVGKVGEGRCGWAHYPPNGERDYDWANPRPVATDIEAWTPEGGPRTVLDARRWGGDSLTWFVYWMENLPGRENGLSYRGRPLTDWWRFVGDWDDANARSLGLVE